MTLRLCVLSATLVAVAGLHGASLRHELADRTAQAAAQRAQIARLAAELAPPLPLAERSRLEARLASVEAVRDQRHTSLRRLLEVSAAAVAADVALIDYREGTRTTEVRIAARENQQTSAFMRALDGPAVGVSLCFSKCPESPAALRLGLLPAKLWLLHKAHTGASGPEAEARTAELLGAKGPDFWVGEELFLPSILDLDG